MGFTVRQAQTGTDSERQAQTGLTGFSANAVFHTPCLKRIIFRTVARTVKGYGRAQSVPLADGVRAALESVRYGRQRR